MEGSKNGTGESYNDAGTEVQVIKNANSRDGNTLGYILQIELVSLGKRLHVNDKEEGSIKENSGCFSKATEYKVVYLLGKGRLEREIDMKGNQGFDVEFIRFEIPAKYKERLTG